MKLFGKKTEPVRCAGAIIMCAMMYLAIAAPNLQAQAIGPTQIGIIGSGTMGGPMGLLWAQAGHEILYSSRNPDQLMDLVQDAAPRASAGYADAAAFFGEVILLAVPPSAIPQIGEDYGHLMQGKVVIDISNPRADRDGVEMTEDWLEMGTGLAMAQYLPGLRFVKAFNTLGSRMLGNPMSDGQRIGVPIASDDPEAIEITAGLAQDLGFEPVIVGALSRAKEFDRGSPIWVTGASAQEIRETLNLR